MKVLVTGGTGFLGSHIVKALLKEKYEVIILKRSFSNTWRINDVLKQVVYYDIDRCDIDIPFKEANHIDAIIHTSTCYGRKNESLTQIYGSNFYFPLQLIEQAIAFNTDTFFNTDTSLYKYLNNYSLSKKYFLDIGKSLADENKINFVNMKLEHIYGPDDDDSKFVTYVLRSCINNIEKLNLTKGEQKRDFIYIEDVVSAYMLLLKNKLILNNSYHEYEVGTGRAISIKELVELIHSMTKSTTKLNFGALSYRENEIMESIANNKELLDLGWINRVSLEKALNKIIKEL